MILPVPKTVTAPPLLSNIIPEELDERATLSRGKPRHYGMMDGIDEGYDLAMFVGVHGSAGAGSSVLSHTFTGHLFDVKINGVSYGELGLNAAMAGVLSRACVSK